MNDIKERFVYINVSKHEPEFSPKVFTLEGVEGIGELAYLLRNHGPVQCAESVKKRGYDLTGFTKEGFHKHISVNVAGLKLGQPEADDFGNEYIPVELISDADTQERIRRYLVEAKGACPTAVNFQN